MTNTLFLRPTVVLLSIGWLLLSTVSHAAGVHGRVHAMDQDGNPVGVVGRATVELLDADGFSVATADTNQSGYYQIRDLPAGRYLYRVIAPGYGLKNEDDERGFTLRSDDGAHVLDFTLIGGSNSTTTELAPINIRVLEQQETENTPLPEMNLVLRSQIYDSVLRGVTDFRGTCRIELPAGEWTVGTAAPGYTQDTPTTLSIRSATEQSVELLVIRVPEAVRPSGGAIALISIAGDAGPIPKVEFFVDEETVPGELGILTPEQFDELGGNLPDAASNWRFCVARPGSPVAGNVRVRSQLAQHDQADSRTRHVLRDAVTVFDLSHESPAVNPTEDTTGNLVGIVRAADDSAPPMQNAVITMKNTDTGDLYSSCPSASGEFSGHIPAGEWQLTAVADGFAPSTPVTVAMLPQEQKDVELTLGETTSETIGVAGAPSTVHGRIFVESTHDGTLDFVAGARIKLRNSKKSVIGEQVSGDGGYYAFDELMTGDYDVTITTQEGIHSTRSVVVASDGRAHILDFMLTRVDHETVTTNEGTVEIAVYEQTPEGKQRRTDANVVVWRGDERMPLGAADPISGNYTALLAPGTWHATATVPGLSGGADNQIGVVPGETTPHEILLNAGSRSRTDATIFIAVKSTDSQSESAVEPTATFIGPSGIIPAVVESVSGEELASQTTDGDSHSNWSWYQAVPSSPLEQGSWRVEGRLHGSPDAVSDEQPVVEDQSTDFTLTFRPVSEQGTLNGMVAANFEGDTSKTFSDGAVIQLKHSESGETRQANVHPSSGRYEVSLPPGDWWVTAKANGFISAPGVQVKLKTRETVERDFVLEQPTLDSNEAIVHALVGLSSDDTATAPKVTFRGSDTTVTATLILLSNDQLAEYGLLESDSTPLSWHLATSEDPLTPGVWTVEATAEGYRSNSASKVVSETGRTEFHLTLARINHEQSAQLTGLVVDDTKAPVPEADVQIWRSDTPDRPLHLRTSTDGAFAASLEQGRWWLVARRDDHYPMTPTVLIVDTAEEHLDVTMIPMVDSPPVSAIVSVKRLFSGATSHTPNVSFAAGDRRFPSHIRRLSDEETGGLAGGGWDMYEAVPAEPLPAGDYVAQAELDQYLPDESDSTAVLDEVAVTFDLTLKPEPVDEPVTIQLAGHVYLDDIETGRRPLPGSRIVLTSLEDGESHEVAASDGVYETLLVPGSWSVSVFNAEYELETSDVITVGDQPEARHDFVLVQEPPVPVDEPQHGAIHAIVDVEQPLPGDSAPHAEFVVYELDERDNLVAVDTVAATLERLQQSDDYNRGRYLAQPVEPMMCGTLCSLKASSSGRYRPSQTEQKAVDLQYPTRFHVTLYPEIQPVQPGTLAGCLIVGGQKPTEGQDGAELLTTPTALPATVVLTFVETQRRHVVRPTDGCFEAELEPGDWKVAVVVDDLEPWHHPGFITIPEGTVVRREFFIPMQQETPPEPTQVRALVAVEHSTATPDSQPPAIFVEMQYTVTVPHLEERTRTIKDQNGNDVEHTYTVTVEHFENHIRRAEFHTRQLTKEEIDSLVSPRSGQWNYFMAEPVEPLPEGECYVIAEPAAFGRPAEPSFSDRRFVAAGIPTFFRINCSRIVPQLQLTVVDTNQQPVAGATVRCIHKDLQHGFSDAIAGQSGENGVAELNLEHGAGMYTVMVTGSDLQPFDQELVVGARASAHTIQVYREGEMRKYALPGYVIGKQSTRVKKGTRRDESGNEVDAFVRETSTSPLANVRVRIRPAAGNPAPPSNGPGLTTNANGEFHWNNVPEGDYLLTAEADGWHTVEQQVNVSAEAAEVVVEIHQRDAALEDPIRQLLTTCWGADADSSDVERFYELAVQADTESIAPDYALALVLLNNQLGERAAAVLESAAQKETGLHGDYNSVVWNRARELLIHLQMQQRRYADCFATMQPLATERYSLDDPHREGPFISNHATHDVSYLMGMACGFVQGPAVEESGAVDATGIERQALQSLEDIHRTDFVAGRDLILDQFHSQSDTAAKQKEMSREQNDRQVSDLIERITQLQDSMKQMVDDHTRQMEQGIQRLNEEDDLLAGHLRKREGLKKSLDRIEDQLAQWKAQLDRILKGQQPGGGGGFGAGGFGPGARISPGGNRNQRQVIPVVLQVGNGNNDELERELRTKIFRAERDRKKLATDLLAIDDVIRTLTDNQVAIDSQMQQADDRFYQTGGEYRNREQDLRQLAAALVKVRKQIVVPETTNPRDEPVSFEDYITFPIEERRQELLSLTSTQSSNNTARPFGSEQLPPPVMDAPPTSSRLPAGNQQETTTLNQESLQKPIDLRSPDKATIHHAIAELTNRKREEHGLKPLVFRQLLTNAAELHAIDMSTDSFFDHTNPNDASRREPGDRARLAGIANPVVAENIAGNFAIQYEAGTPLSDPPPAPGVFTDGSGKIIPVHTPLTLANALVTQWMNSPGHRANILDSEAVEIGCGVAFYDLDKDGGVPRVNAVQLFQRGDFTYSE